MVMPAFISRVSNASVLKKSGHKAATDLLGKRQLQLLGKILRTTDGHPLKAVSFCPGFRPATDRFVRRIGRPSKEGIPEMVKKAIEI